MSKGQDIKFKAFIVSGLAIISFGHIVVQLFGQTIPNVVIAFFKDAGVAVIVAFVFLFALTWLVKARPHNLPKKYMVLVFDVFGKESQIEGIRTEFKTHDVGWSFMKQYKKSYPLHSFALVSDTPNSEKKTIFRYI